MYGLMRTSVLIVLISTSVRKKQKGYWTQSRINETTHLPLLSLLESCK